MKLTKQKYANDYYDYLFGIKQSEQITTKIFINLKFRTIDTLNSMHVHPLFDFKILRNEKPRTGQYYSTFSIRFYIQNNFTFGCTTSSCTFCMTHIRSRRGTSTSFYFRCSNITRQKIRNQATVLQLLLATNI